MKPVQMVLFQWCFLFQASSYRQAKLLADAICAYDLPKFLITVSHWAGGWEAGNRSKGSNPSGQREASVERLSLTESQGMEFAQRVKPAHRRLAGLF